MKQKRAETGAVRKRAPQVKKPKEEPDTPMRRLKLLIAGELGLMDKVKADGWGGLSAAESGRVGGLMAKRMKDDPAVLERLMAARSN